MRWRLAIALGLTGCGSFGDSTSAQPGDAGSLNDAATTGDSATARFCETPTSLCEDFDGDTTGGWSGRVDDKRTGAGSKLELGLHGKEAGGLRATVPADTGETPTIAARQFISDGVGDIVVEADLFIEDPSIAGGTSGIGVLQVRFGAGPTETAPIVEVRVAPVKQGGSLYLHARPRATEQYNASAPPGDSRVLPYGTWCHITLIAAVAVGGGPDEGLAMVTEANIGERKSTFTRAPLNGEQTTTTSAGLIRSLPTSVPLTVRIDNVVARAR